MVLQIMEGEVLEARASGDLTPDPRDMDPTVRAARRWVRENPRAIRVVLQPVSQDGLRGLAKDHATRSGLRLGQQQHPLRQMNHVLPKGSDIALSHQAERGEFRHRLEWLSDHVESQEFLLWAQKPDPSVVLLCKRIPGKLELRSDLLEHRSDCAEVPIDRAWLRPRPLASLPEGVYVGFRNGTDWRSEQTR